MSKIRIQLSTSTKRYFRSLASGSQTQVLYTKILQIMDRQAALTAGYISKNYLSGQRLNRITGTLARSIVGSGETVRGLPAMRVGVLAGPALAYAGALEGDPDSDQKNPLTGIQPRHYLRDGMDWGVAEVTRKIEDLIVSIMRGTSP